MTKGETVLSLKGKLRYLYALDKSLPKLINANSILTTDIQKCYVPQNLVQTENGDEKHPIDLADVFFQEGDHKILLEGGFGVGKTVLLQIISRKWSEEVIGNRYDSVYKLKLSLLVSDWQRNYNPEALDNNKLACFIHYSTGKLVAKIEAQIGSKLKYKVTLDEIIEDINKDDKNKILLLLDGDNELNALLRDNEAKVLINEMIDFPNSFTTSRMNSLPMIFRNEFDTIVEVTGFSPNEAREYINKYLFYQHKSIAEKVENFFSTNPSNSDLKEALLGWLSKTTRKDYEKYEVYLQLKKIDNFLLGKLGSNEQEIQTSILKYYEESRDLLNSLLEEVTVKELLENPMITSMVCLVFCDPESRAELKENLTIGKLYEEFIIWLTKKYLSNPDEDMESITRDNITNSKEIVVLKEIAFHAMQNSNVIDGKFISKVATEHGLNIERLYNLGLLKVAIYKESADRDSLVAHKHSFARLTVQDYLAALFLKEKLMSKDVATSREAAEFIAEHRNEKQYLMMLKFTAEMITKATLVSDEPLISFWEAVTCNIDGVLELGLNMKVTLLMHLINSAKIGGEIDSRIPNKEDIIDFIDSVVLEDLLKWGEEIKTSGYISPKLKKYIWDKWISLESIIMLQEEPASDNELLFDKQANKMSDINKLVNVIISSIDYLDNNELLSSIYTRLDNDDDRIKELAIKMIHQFAKRSKEAFSPERIEELIEKIIKYTKNNKLKEHSMNALASLVEISDNQKMLVLKILEESFPFLEDKVICDSVVKLIIKEIIDSEKYSSEVDIIKLLLDKLKICINTFFNIGDQFLSFSSDGIDSSPRSPETPNNKLIGMSSVSEEITLGPNKISNSLAREALDNIAKILIGIVNNGLLKILDPVFDCLISSMLDNQQKREGASYVICKIVQKAPNTLNTVLQKLIPLLSDGEGLETKLSLINNILSNQKAKIDTETAYSLIDKLRSFLEKEISVENDLIISTIGNIAFFAEKISPKKITELLNELNQYKDVSAKIYELYAKIAELGEESALETAFNLLIAAYDNPSLGVDASSEIPSALSKITQVINNKEKENIWIGLLIQKMQASANNKAIFVIPIVNILSKGKVGAEYVEEVLNIFIALLKNLTYISKETIDAICKCGKSEEAIKKSFFIKLFEILKTSSSDNKVYSRLVEIISKLDYNSKENEELFEILVSDSVFHNLPTSTVARSIANSIQGSKELSANALLKMYNFLEHEDKGVIEKALYTIGKIIKKGILDAKMLEYFLQKMIPLLKDEFLKEQALYVMSKIYAKEGIAIVNFEDTLRILMDIPGSQDSINAQNSALFVIGEMACKEVIPKEMKPKILTILSLSISESSTKYVALEALSKIIKVMKLEEYVALLDDPNHEVRALASRVLSEKIEIPGDWDFKIIQILNILSSNNYENDPEIKKLHDLAKKMSSILIAELEESNLCWINKEFENLLEISATGFKDIALQLYDLALSDGVISSEEEKLIEQCISKFGFTTVIHNPKTDEKGNINFTIIFHNREYKFSGEENLKHLERITSALIKSQDILASQYRNNEPLFFNTGTGIEVAASDIKSCKSIVNGEELTTNAFQVSLLFLSDNNRKLPTAGFLLLEKRNNEGYYIAYKLSLNENKKIIKRHPEKMDDCRESIFTKMQYVDSKITYYGKTELLDFNDLESLVAKFHNVQYVQFGDGYTGLISFLKEIAQDSSLGPIVKDLVKDLSGNWAEDSLGLSPYFKKDLLKENTSRESLIIDDHEEIQKYGEKIQNIENILENINIKVLEALIDKETLANEDKEEVRKIEADPYKFAFYKALIWQLNSVYIACSAIYSGMVKNENKGIAGNIGSLLGFLSDHTPMVGIGVDIIGQMLQGIDEFQQKEKVNNYFRIAKDSQEMSRLVELIARKLILANSDFAIKTEIIDTLGALSNSIVEATDLSVSGVVTAACQEFKERLNKMEEGKRSGDHPRDLLDYVKRFVLNQYEDTDKSRGEKAANVVAKLILKNIFSGKYSNIDNNTQFIDSIVQDVILQAVDSTQAVTPETPSSTQAVAIDNSEHINESCCGRLVTFVNSIIEYFSPRAVGNTDDGTDRSTLSTNSPNPIDNTKSASTISEIVVLRVDESKFKNPIINHELFPQICKAAMDIDKTHGLDRLLEICKDEGKYKKLLESFKSKTFKEAISEAVSGDSNNDKPEEDKLLEQVIDLSKKIERDGAIEDKDFEEYIKKYKEIIGEEGFREHPELLKYVDAVIFKNKYSSFFTGMLKNVVDLANNIQKLLDKEAWYEFLGIDTRDEVAIKWIQLNGLLEFMISEGRKIPISRPPFYNPGDDFGGAGGGGSGGGSSGDGGSSKGSGNDTDNGVLFPTFWLPLNTFESNPTSFVGNNTLHKIDLE